MPSEEMSPFRGGRALSNQAFLGFLLVFSFLTTGTAKLAALIFAKETWFEQIVSALNVKLSLDLFERAESTIQYALSLALFPVGLFVCLLLIAPRFEIPEAFSLSDVGSADWRRWETSVFRLAVIVAPTIVLWLALPILANSRGNAGAVLALYPFFGIGTAICCVLGGGTIVVLHKLIKLRSQPNE